MLYVTIQMPRGPVWKVPTLRQYSTLIRVLVHRGGKLL
jgi:hypothetical protein